jgi:predicted AlkP superfamily phosphohydrolase/phosphomutase
MKSILLGLDAFDPGIFEKLSQQNRLPNLGKYATAGNYARLTVSNPPQSEVSWTSIATGADPGVHGMFDFVLRDPATYAISPSLLITKTSLVGAQFIPPFTTRTLFEQATIDGFPATVLWWPATFPARLELPVQTIPGLGTPDIQGRIGVGAVYSPDRDLADSRYKTPVELLEQQNHDAYRGWLHGPSQKTAQGSKETSLEFHLDIQDQKSAKITFAKKSLDLQLGQWSPIFEVNFKAGFLVSIPAVTRAILTQIVPEPRLYFLPLQVHPLHSPWRYGTPPGFVRETWKGYGPFLTLGWPQDTTGLEEGWISDDQFIALCHKIDETRERIFFHYLDKFQEGVLANVFDTLDRVQHMFLQDRPEVVETWYEHLDTLIGKVEEKINARGKGKPRLLILSDHGFTRFDYQVHLNQWLIENHYLALKDGAQEHSLRSVDWNRSQAYALGLNSLYLNIQGREGQGIVLPTEIEPLRQRLRQDLLNWKGSGMPSGEGRPVFQQVYVREEAFNGPLLPQAPDLVLGYSPGYRASAETGLGKWETIALVPNQDHWHADHCIDPQAVPGVLFTNFNLSNTLGTNIPQPSFRDIPALAIGKSLKHADQPIKLPPHQSDEDQKTIDERLKGLGYL